MKRTVATVAAGLWLSSCAGTQLTGPAAKQAEFDQACKYASGALAAAKPAIPLVQGLLLARFGQDASTAFQVAIQVIQTGCGQPLDVTSPDAVIQRIYDAGGQIVALVVKSQAPAP